MKKLKDLLGLILFYVVLIFGTIALNLRFEYLNKLKSTGISYTSTSTNQHQSKLID